jgi:site-specific recombinase XerD
MDTIVKYDTTTLAAQHNQLDLLKESVLARLTDNTKRAYDRALTDYIVWSQGNGQSMDYTAINSYIDSLHNAGMGSSTTNQRLSAIKKFAKEAFNRNWIDSEIYTRIDNIESIKVQGQKLGNWLSKTQVEEAINTPNTLTLKGRRDRAILGILFGAGLRREELCNLRVSQIQQRDGRWVIVDITGKGNKTRSVPIAAWVRRLINDWLEVYTPTEYLFVSVYKGDNVRDEQLTPHAIYKIVQSYLPDVAPHDLRRTFAQLARKAGAGIEQIQLSLGHESVKTTEKYLGTRQDLQNAPSDFIKLDID